MYDRLALTVEPASVNLVPLGSRLISEPELMLTSASSVDTQVTLSTEGATTSTQANTFMMLSLQNKNKKKGFKSAPTIIPAKIVFTTEERDSIAKSPQIHHVAGRLSVDDNFVSVEQMTPSKAAPTNNSRLVPPSEKQEQGLLPSNMFVTSVDVEEAMQNKKRKTKKQTHGSKDSCAGPVRVPDVYEDAVLNLVDGNSALDETLEAATQLGITEIEGQWNSFRRITEPSQVVRNAIVGWKVSRLLPNKFWFLPFQIHSNSSVFKALAINPATFTPELMLHRGSVMECENKLTVELLQDSERDAIELSFGGPLEIDGDAVGPVEESFGWTDVLQGDFRIIQT